MRHDSVGTDTSIRERALIFLMALVSRAIVAWIFFGSVDATNAMLNSERLFAGMRPSEIPVPYFPGVYQLLIWTSGVLTVRTALPVGFCYKLFPLLFDAVLSMIIYDFLINDRRRARRAAILYALAPVPILITVIHTQWDSISLVFLLLSFLLVAKRSPAASALAGVLFGVSVLVKPIPIPLLPLLFPSPWRLFARGEGGRGARQTTLAILGGISVCAALYVGSLYAVGDPPGPGVVRGIAAYAAHGVQLFGLPVLLEIGTNRLLSLVPLLLLVPLVWKRIISREEAAMLSFAAILATAGMGAQYLVWIVPFLLICGRERYAALYSLLAGLFLVIYYHHPGPDNVNLENLGAFAPLRTLSWLAPSATFLQAKMFLYVFLSSFAVPVSALVFFVLVLLQRARSSQRIEEMAPQLSLRSLIAPTLTVSAAVAIAAAVALAMPEPTANDFAESLRVKAAHYAMVRSSIHRGKLPGSVQPDEQPWVIPAYAGREVEQRGSLIDAASIGYGWVILWSVAAWTPWPKGRGR